MLLPEIDYEEEWKKTFQVIAAIFGGIVTDKIGRRLTTIIFDLISWSIPCLLWAFAQNFWWFLAATIFNSAWQITNNSWNCLLVEDSEESLLVNVYTWVHISGLVSVFFAPISTFFVENFSMEATVRVWFVDKEERARVNGVIYVLMIGFSIPFGWLNGILSSVNRQLPFVLNIFIFLICLVMILRSKVLDNHDN